MLGNGNIINIISCEDEFMKPVIADDPLLMFDMEDDNLLNEQEDVESKSYTGSTKDSNNLDPKMLILKHKLAAAEQQMEEMKNKLKIVMGLGDDADRGCPSQTKPVDEDEDPYFSSYSHFGIHLEMLQDKERTESYREALCNSADIAGKTVLDVGCGTGILSMFAAKAGAKLVVGVDHSEIVYRAIDIVRENNLDKSVVLLKGRMEDVDLPVEEVDVIVSEWMGYFLLFECMLDTVIWARDHYLKPGGEMMPRICSLSLAAIHDPDRYKGYISFWDDVYGFTMRCMKSEVIKEASVELVDKETIVTDTCVLKTFDMMTCTCDDVQFSQQFQLTLSENKPLTAFVGFFNCIFQSSSNKTVELNTSPFSPATHWKQTVFHLPEPISIPGNQLEVKFTCHRIPKDPRSLKVTIQLLGRRFTYYLQ